MRKKLIWPAALAALVLGIGLVLGLGGEPEQAAANAANVPVVIDGPFWNEHEENHWWGSSAEYEQIGEARIREGYAYLPLRVVFEACGAEVGWDRNTGIISARWLDSWGQEKGLEMRLSEKSAQLWGSGWEKRQDLAAAAFAEEGVVYVPLRFVGEALGCGVDWREQGAVPGFGGEPWPSSGPVVYLSRNMNWGKGRLINRGEHRLLEYEWGEGEKGQLWRLDCGSGVVSRKLLAEEPESWQKMGRLDMAALNMERSEGGIWRWSDWEIRQTPAGNWQLIIQGDLWAENWEQLPITEHILRGYRIYGYVPEKQPGEDYWTGYGYEPQGVGGKLAEPLWISGKNGRGELLLPGEAEVLVIDDGGGRLTERLAGAPLKWANQDYVLFGDGAEWLLVDRENGQRRDLSGEVLSGANRRRLEEQVRPYLADLDKEKFWGQLAAARPEEPYALVQFRGEEKGNLQFILVGVYVKAQENMRVEINIPLK